MAEWHILLEYNKTIFNWLFLCSVNLAKGQFASEWIAREKPSILTYDTVHQIGVTQNGLPYTDWN